jgi:hypothetical protein
MSIDGLMELLAKRLKLKYQMLESPDDRKTHFRARKEICSLITVEHIIELIRDRYKSLYIVTRLDDSTVNTDARLEARDQDRCLCRLIDIHLIDDNSFDLIIEHFPAFKGRGPKPRFTRSAQIGLLGRHLDARTACA